MQTEKKMPQQLSSEERSTLKLLRGLSREYDTQTIQHNTLQYNALYLCLLTAKLVHRELRQIALVSALNGAANVVRQLFVIE